MLIESVLAAAQPYLQGKKVQDMSIGISLLAVELNDGSIGVSYVLREDLKAGCSIFPYGQQVVGQGAALIADWALSGGDSLQRGIGIAVLTATSRSQILNDCDSPEHPFGIAVRDTDRLGLIGYIAPVAKMLGARAKEMYIFDKGISQLGGSHGKVQPLEEQARLLPECDIVVLSGTTMINGTIEELLPLCANAREVVMIGASTPMYPEAFLNTKVTVLAGSWWKESKKRDIFRRISLACGISELSDCTIKKSVRVR